jgi:2-polyprenyl-6-methoxyphenol hydroxylase-like FAD-dependent oxidoreductase
MTHALIIGASMAGLLAARVLSDHFERVTIIERDDLPQNGEYRAGVPQARHLHVMLVRGERILEDLFPGFTDDLKAAGAVQGVWGLDNAFYTVGGWTPRFDSGLVSHIVGRANLEWLVRRRVQAIPNVSIQTGCEVIQLISDDHRQIVTGVKVETRGTHTIETVPADLIVDASGRNSKARQWLQELGYDTPEETLVDAHCGYATRWYERPAHIRPVTFAIQPRPKEGLYRGAGMMPVEGNQWVVTLLGANGDYPPTDEEGFMSFAQSLSTPVIYRLIKDARPISGISGYRKLENRWQRYERLRRLPEHFILIGDSVCALNPIYGQGMTKAALEAELLGKLLRQRGARDLTGLPRQWQERVAQNIVGAWMMATSEDRRYPSVEGQKADRFSRFANWYFDRVALTMPYDTQISLAFFRAMSLLRDPRSLARPDIAARVMWRWLVTSRLPSRHSRASAGWETIADC